MKTFAPKGQYKPITSFLWAGTFRGHPPGSAPREHPPGASPGSTPREHPPGAPPGSTPPEPPPGAPPGAPVLAPVFEHLPYETLSSGIENPPHRPPPRLGSRTPPSAPLQNWGPGPPFRPPPRTLPTNPPFLKQPTAPKCTSRFYVVRIPGGKWQGPGRG